MSSLKRFSRILTTFLIRPAATDTATTDRSCPSCGYILDRPHAAICPRCRASIPGAGGCNGCGRCRGS